MVIALTDLPGAAPGVGGLVMTAVVLLAMAVTAWLLRRGTLSLPAAWRRGKTTTFNVETAFSLGERRTLAVVSVEGRRLLLGLTPASISLIMELPRESTAFSATLDRHTPPGGPS